jgi:hypothetical protein
MAVRCAPKQIVTQMAKYLDGLGYAVGKPARLMSSRFGHEVYMFSVYQMRRSGTINYDEAVDITFDPKSCDLFVTTGAYYDKAEAKKLAHEIDAALRKLQP